jgi:hypothetical protein
MNEMGVSGWDLVFQSFFVGLFFPSEGGEFKTGFIRVKHAIAFWW